VINFDESETQLSVSNCMSRLKRRMRLKVNVDRELEFIATHISNFEIDDIRDIDITIVEAILQKHSLRIPNEDWLLRMIFELGGIHHRLIRYVHFEFLSPESIDLFFDTISVDELDAEIFERMRTRMRHRIVYDREELLNS
jgi:hypothetical protein